MKPEFQKECLPYSQTNKFTKIVTDYIDGDARLTPFFEYPVSLDGIQSAIDNRKKHPVDRQLLVDQLLIQYENLDGSDFYKNRIKVLLKENVFTVCTAHQPNIFTGHLYFIYKIIHAIKCCKAFAAQFPAYEFVPVFFMGSEDADLEELNHIWLEGMKYEWETDQKGAVGRMKVDEPLLKMLGALEGRLKAEPFGEEIVTVLKRSFSKGNTIEQATFQLVHELFKDFGLIVLLPDNKDYKRKMISIFEEDLFNHTPGRIVENTSKELSEHYTAQAFPRDINLFYMKGDVRNRIIETGDKFIVHDTDISFSKEELLDELKEHPERFSPNVILRGLLQEMILPDVAFIGGGGELAYWLQLKDLFKYFQVPFPVLILRNSFLIIEKKWMEFIEKLGLKKRDIFKNDEELFKSLVITKTQNDLSLEEEKNSIRSFYEDLKKKVLKIDEQLNDHLEALQTRQLKRIDALEKKLLRAEKKKFESSKNQLNKLMNALAPDNGLQERTENFLLFYAKWGPDFLKAIEDASPVLDAEFCILTEK